MQTSTAQSRTPAQAPTPAVRSTAPATSTSNQEVQAAAGLAAAPPEASGDLLGTMLLMGATAIVVLDAMPLPISIPYALRMCATDWARDWLAENALEALSVLNEPLQEQVIDVLLPPGAAYEYTLEQELLLGVGGIFSGSCRLARPHGSWTLTLRGRLAGAARAGLGVGQSVGNVGAELSGDLQMELGPELEAEWVLANAGLTAARVAVLESVLAATFPVLDGILELVAPQAPDRLELEERFGMSAEAGLGMDAGINGAGGNSLDLAGAAPAVTQGIPLTDTLASVRDTVLGVLEGVEGGASLKLSGSAGYDPDPFVAVEAEGTIGGAAGGSEARSTMGVRAVAYLMADERGVTVVGGTLASSVTNHGDSTTVEQPWNGLAGLVERLSNLAGTGAAQDVGDLVIDTEHTVADVQSLEAVVGPLERGIDIPLFEEEGEVKARVKVRVAGDTSAAFPSAQPAHEEEARDLQRALAGVVTGRAYLADSELREEGVIDAVTLDEAVIEAAWEKQLELGAKLGLGAGAEARTASTSKYSTTTDVSPSVNLDGVATMLNA